MPRRIRKEVYLGPRRVRELEKNEKSKIRGGEDICARHGIVPNIIFL